MKSLFIFSDIHSFYDELMTALHEAGYDENNKNHIIVSCGDLFDRGPKSKELLTWINNIPNNKKILLFGNHEDLMTDAICRREFLYHDYHNGTIKTACQLTNSDEYSCNDTYVLGKMHDYKPWWDYIDSCIDYFETDKFIFVHGWIPCTRKEIFDNDWHKSIVWEMTEDWREGDWIGARWKCCYDAWAAGITIPNKTIIAGHWHTSYGHSKYHNKGSEWNVNPINLELFTEDETANFEPFIDDGIIGIDACTAVSKKVNVIKIDVEDYEVNFLEQKEKTNG